jgi:hypothetical protein
VDVDQFDHLSRVVAQSSSRRAALGTVAALGLAAAPVAARKKPKNGCKRGCGPCQVCRKNGKKKMCVTAPDGTLCTGGACQAGSCCQSSCAGLGNVCGPVSNGCGGTLTCTCGAGRTPACDDGRCATCATTCPAGCDVCATRIDGTTECGASSVASCSDTCSSDVDCPTSDPFCLISRTERLSGETTNLPFFCGRTSAGICSRITPCRAI